MNRTSTNEHVCAERARLAATRKREAHWRRFGPYLSDRQWGTVREDYGEGGAAWEAFPHDHARSRAYRWGEDGLLGISDDHQRLCFALALWNGRDPILKERFFGLTGLEGNHGEDVKEYYFYLDNVPTHSYMKALYKYPQAAFPYEELKDRNVARGRRQREYDLLDTGVFDRGRYFDVFVSYAKDSPSDICVEIEIVNRGDVAATLHALPTLWFRNDWSWKPGRAKPLIHDAWRGDEKVLRATHPALGTHFLYGSPACEALFTENETNAERLFGTKSASPYVKDGIGERVVRGRVDAVNPDRVGTKASLWHVVSLEPGERRVLRLRLADRGDLRDPLGSECTDIFARRKREADEFYAELNPFPISDDARAIQRQAFAGMLWSKQFYHHVVRDVLEGDPTQPCATGGRAIGPTIP